MFFKQVFAKQIASQVSRATGKCFKIGVFKIIFVRGNFSKKKRNRNGWVVRLKSGNLQKGQENYFQSGRICPFISQFQNTGLLNRQYLHLKPKVGHSLQVDKEELSSSLSNSTIAKTFFFGNFPDFYLTYQKFRVSFLSAVRHYNFPFVQGTRV